MLKLPDSGLKNVSLFKDLTFADFQKYFPLMTLLILITALLRIYTKYEFLDLNVLSFMSLNDFFLVFINDSLFLFFLTAGFTLLDLVIAVVLKIIKQRFRSWKYVLVIFYSWLSYGFFWIGIIGVNPILYLGRQRIIFSYVTFYLLVLLSAVLLFVIRKRTEKKARALSIMSLIFAVYNLFLIAHFLFPYDYQQEKVSTFLTPEIVDITTANSDSVTLRGCNLLFMSETFALVDEHPDKIPDSTAIRFIYVTALPISGITGIRYKSRYERYFAANIRRLNHIWDREEKTNP